MNKEKLAKFLGTSRATAFNWVNEGRPAAIFIEKYLDENDVDEFIKNGKIRKFENIEKIEDFVLFCKELDFFSQQLFDLFLLYVKNENIFSIAGFIIFITAQNFETSNIAKIFIAQIIHLSSLYPSTEREIKFFIYKFGFENFEKKIL